MPRSGETPLSVALAAVHKHGSFKKANEELGVTKVENGIRHVERRVGEPLVITSTDRYAHRTVELTLLGKYFIGDATIIPEGLA